MALVMNGLNLFEPLTVDDVCHHYYAEQVARDPLRPFEFDLVWHQKPVAAWDVMVAPVTSYWWAPAVAWFPDRPIVWKAWFLPFQWLLCASLLRLLQRLLRRGAVAVTSMVVLGPALLPGVNLMLEVPVLALGFASLDLLVSASERRRGWLAILAGTLLGLAFQTKYSAMGFLAPWGIAAVLLRSWRMLALGLPCAVAVAASVEALLSWSHGGGSYFLRQLELTQTRDWFHMIRGMVSQVGVLALPAALLALRGLRAPAWTSCALLAVHVFGYGIVAVVPAIGDRSLATGALDTWAYLGMAMATWGVLGWVLWVLARTTLPRWLDGRVSRSIAMRTAWLLWVPAELVSSFVVSPFPAARRSLLVVVAMTCTAGWLAARRREASGAMRAIAAGTVLLGIGYQGIDYLEGRACVEAARRAAAFAEAENPRAQVWFTGGWGFEFYAPRAGMKPLLRGVSTVAKGDWIAIGSIDGAEEPWFHWNGKIELVTEIGVGDAVPWSLLFGYYSGRRPIDGQSGPRFVVWVYRAVETFHAKELPARVNPWRDH